ncbi:MAG: sulfite exporter TauE/SafE family protein [Bacteroidetes bacterium]|jgi:hypothetical protein|nr:sulfite exporter TauE/SafE family protein [Bacteroidota bacterium]
MTPEQLPLLAAGILVIAFLYSSVGHAGASGYIAVMSLLSVAPEVIRPTALVLNILVASIASWQFWRSGNFSWRLFWPFAVAALPLAFVGGYIALPAEVLKRLIGLVLLASAARLLFKPPDDVVVSEPSRFVAVLLGGGLGLLAGMTGTGGGIFLTPVLILFGWAKAKTAGAVSAVFILVNSTAGLLGNLSATSAFPTPALALALAAIVGGSAGSYLGSRRLPHTAIKRLLAVVLTIAGAKLMFSV